MTEEEALEEISQIFSRYAEEDSNPPSDPVSVYKRLLNIAIEQPAGKTPYQAVRTCCAIKGYSRPMRFIKTPEIGYIVSTARYLEEILRRIPEVKKEALQLNDLMYDQLRALNYERFTPNQISLTGRTLHGLINNNPQSYDKAFAVLKKMTDESDDYATLPHICNSLNSILDAKPEALDKVWNFIKNDLHPQKNPEDLLKETSPLLQSLVAKKPDLADEIYDFVVSKLSEDKSSSDSIVQGYFLLSRLIKAKPELTDKILPTIQNNLQNDQPDNVYVLNSIITALCTAALVKPETTDEAFALIETTYPKMGSYLLSDFCANFIDYEKYPPKLADKLFAAVEGFTQRNTLVYGYSSHVYIALGSVVRSKPELAEKILNMCPLCEKEDDLAFDYSYHTLKACMRYLPLEETIAKHPEMKEDLRLAYNARFASADELIYAVGHFDKSKLTAPESRIFHNQQADFSMLLEREAALNGISGKEICRYRHVDATRRVKDFYDEQKGWIVPASFKTSQLFARKSQTKTDADAVSLSSYLDKARKCGISPHDAVDILPEPASPQANARVTRFIHRNLERVLQNKSALNDLKLIINNWDAVEKKLAIPAERAQICRINDKGVLTDNLDYAKVLKLCLSIIYQNQRSQRFAEEASNPKNHISATEYHKAEDIYLAGLKVPEPFDSKIEFKCGNYTAHYLSRDDPRAIFFGNETDCCQRYGGIGHECAVSTVMHPFSQLFVVENNQGEIIAGSWVWENTEGKYRDVCFDNIEIKGDYSKEQLDDLKEKRNDSVANMIDCLDTVDAPELLNLWKEYFQILRDCDLQVQQSAAVPPKLEQLKKVSQVIDNKLQAKEIKALPTYEQIAENWKSHKEIQQHYTSRKKVADAIKSLYEQAGQYLTKPEQNCRLVTIGKGRQDLDISDYPDTEAVMLPKLYGYGYTDSKFQVLLAENPMAKPLDKTEETQRYVRDVCYLDVPAMERVCAAVFTGHDKKLARPNNLDDLAGFVIEDREKGVVGYCLYQKFDDDSYYIPDTAVLPEYRTDKNASSKKLFAEMIRCVREKGGVWYAEMREETSLRYLKAMTERGLAKHEILSDYEAERIGLNAARQMEYDPKLKTASMVYPVRFEVVRDDVRQATANAKNKLPTKKHETAAATVALPTNNRPTPPRFSGRNSNENTA